MSETSSTKKCPFCAEDIKKDAVFCKYCQTNLILNNSDNGTNDFKQIKENKMTCSACGNIWYYGKKEVNTNFSNSLHNAGSSAMCCSGCFPALFIPQKNVIDLKKCQKCGSRAVKIEEVIHNV